MADFDISHELEWLRHLLYQSLVKQHTILCELQTIRQSQEKTMAEIDNLNANIAKLSADVDALLAKPAPPAGVDPAAVQAAADAVAAIDAKVVPAP